jgi:hypothetical protein
MPKLAIAGALSATPSLPTSAESFEDDFDLSLLAQYPNVDGGDASVASTDSVPFVLDPQGVTAIRLLALRSLDGVSLKAKVTTALGVDQVLPFSDLLVLHAPGAAPPFTAVKIVGTGRVEWLAAGDAGQDLPPPPPVFGVDSLTLSQIGSAYVAGANEQVLVQWTVNFSNLPLSSVRAAVTLLTRQVTGPGAYFVRWGGTEGMADGTIVLSFLTNHPGPTYPGTPDAATGSPFANPGGPQLVKLTGNGSGAGDQAHARAAQVVFAGP